MGPGKFEEAPNTAVFVCERVWRNEEPILRVSCDGEGDWQFLCGGDHAEESGDPGMLVCLEHVVERDPTVGELGDMCPLWSAERKSPDDAWTRHDGMEEIVRENVAKYGWHVMGIPAEGEDPAFAYSIGMYETLGSPEIICLGLGIELMQQLINLAGDIVKRTGAPLTEGARSAELLEGFECEFRTVSREFYREHLGYALWYHDGPRFPALQLVWPDREHRFPWDPGTDSLKKRQPELYAT